mgnify:FL=1
MDEWLVLNAVSDEYKYEFKHYSEQFRNSYSVYISMLNVVWVVTS